MRITPEKIRLACKILESVVKEEAEKDKYAILLTVKEIKIIHNALIVALHAYFCHWNLTTEERQELERIKEVFGEIA